MTAPIPNATAGANADEKQQYINREITVWVGNLRLEQALKAKELGALSMLEKWWRSATG